MVPKFSCNDPGGTLESEPIKGEKLESAGGSWRCPGPPRDIAGGMFAIAERHGIVGPYGMAGYEPPPAIPASCNNNSRVSIGRHNFQEQGRQDEQERWSAEVR